MCFHKGEAVAEDRKLIWDFPAVTDIFSLMTLVWCFFLGSTFVQTFPLSITVSLRRGCYYSSIKMQSLPAHLVRKGRARSQVSCSSTPPRGPGTFADVTGLICPPANSLWHMPYATFPEAIGEVPAAEICVGRCLDGYHSMCGPHSISFTRSLLATQVPGSHADLWSGVWYLCFNTPSICFWSSLQF